MSKKFFLGVDGGGTKTKVYVIDENGKELYIGIGGPSSIDSVSIENSINSVNAALKNYKEKVDFDAAFIGLGGIQDASDEMTYLEHSSNIKGISAKTKVYAKNDTFNALATSLKFDEGVVIIAGTGMNCLGIDATGKYHFAGGLGFLEGDLGSAFSLGYHSMRSLARALDGRIDLTAYHEKLMERTGVNSPVKIKEYFHNYIKSRTEVASLARITTDFAGAGNIYAQEICNMAANELLLCVKAVMKNINLKNKTLTIIGGLGTNESYFTKRLHKIVKDFDKNIKIQGPKVDPALAAALLAKHKYEKK